ncbi:hypothetical protein [Streptomyces sp. NBC_00385]|uniref:hypothetical protein n=1 Tax=Streptomyces sp. NBC_00385 TaxID=2975733 RepID=UPI002DD9FFE4|nr:hypothetical protein [Streptomyces sp. NBC_00385]WRZ02930.1 hypothetical protein OG959_06005 [Streptomyces sp. NBC_00385]
MCLLRPFEESLAIGLTNYLTRVRPAEHVVVIEDRADPTSAVEAPRGGVAARILRSDDRGMTRRLSFDGTRRVDCTTGSLLHRVDKGRLRFLGPAASA